MASINVLGIGDTFQSDEWQRYGIVQVQVGSKTYDVAAVIGVPESQQQTAQASGGRIASYLTAWFADASDWSEARCDDGTEGVPQRLVDEIEAAIADEAARLWDEAQGR